MADIIRGGWRPAPAPKPKPKPGQGGCELVIIFRPCGMQEGGMVGQGDPSIITTV